jgi:Holliday junction resolvase
VVLVLGPDARFVVVPSMSTPEKKVKKTITDELKAHGVYYFFPATGGYGTSGVPDIVGCYRGMFFAIECKAGDNQPTALQENQLRRIKTAGGVSCVMREANAAGVMVWLKCAYAQWELKLRRDGDAGMSDSVFGV